MINFIICSKDLGDLMDFTYAEYDKFCPSFTPESLRWEFTDSPLVFTVDYKGENRLYTMSTRLVDGNLHTVVKYNETKTPEGFKYSFIKKARDFDEALCGSTNAIFACLILFIAAFGLADKVDRENPLQSIVISRKGEKFMGEILCAEDRPDVLLVGPLGEKLRGRPTGEEQPEYVNI